LRPRPPKKRGDLRPLAALFDILGSEPLPPFLGKQLADLFERHRLQATSTRAPRYAMTIAELTEQKYVDATLDYRDQNYHGPITKAEMEAAVQELKERAKAKGRGNRLFDGKAAATQLREERLSEFCKQNNLDSDYLKNVLNGKSGQINRRYKPAARRRRTR
jgi:hypothetical protein